MFKFLSKIGQALTKTTLFFKKRLSDIFVKPLNEESKQMLEELLYEADLGSSVVSHFMQEIEKYAKSHPHAKENDYIDALEKIALDILEKKTPNLSSFPAINFPKIILMVGVNGTGKTTSIAKLGKMYKDQGKKVLFACGDTFRAAATEQLKIHAENLGVDIVLSKHGADPGAVIFDAIEKAKTLNYDVVICDTAGRLENKIELLDELKKIDRVIKKIDPFAPHETFLTIDAALGSTTLHQVENFQKFLKITGLILTKIDSTAKGGIALSIYKKYQIPICYVGFGETLCDFSPFDAKSYAKALFKE
jgi:fused signal recognition particle receptor